MNRLQRLLTTLLLSVSGAASGALMSDSVPGSGTLRNDNSNGTGFSTVSVNSPSFSGRAGMYHGHFYPGSFTDDSFFRFFCIELGQNAVASATYTGSIWNNEAVQRLFDVAFPNKSVGNFYHGGITNFGVFSTAQAAAAFQLAIWELVFDADNRDLTGGAFHVTGSSPAAITALAQSWLDVLDSSTSWSQWTLYRFTNDRRQDYVSGTFGVSEPATLALAGFGVLLLVIGGRRQRPRS